MESVRKKKEKKLTARNKYNGKDRKIDEIASPLSKFRSEFLNLSSSLRFQIYIYIYFKLITRY